MAKAFKKNIENVHQLSPELPYTSHSQIPEKRHHSTFFVTSLYMYNKNFTLNTYIHRINCLLWNIGVVYLTSFWEEGCQAVLIPKPATCLFVTLNQRTQSNHSTHEAHTLLTFTDINTYKNNNSWNVHHFHTTVLNSNRITHNSYRS